MKKLAIIGASYLQEPLVRKAKEMGLYTICFAWAEGATCATVCDKFYAISIVEKEKILEICQQEHIDGIATIASDVAAPIVAFVAGKMGLVGNEYEVAVRANNKYLMRNSFMTNGIPCPKYVMLTEKDRQELESLFVNCDLQFPLIVKPSDRSGSLGVTKVETREELQIAIDKAISLSFKKQVMIEEFIDGREISVEFISYQGKHYPLQITDKVTTGAPHFVELAHYQPSSLVPKQYEDVYDITRKSLNALGIINGASHSEYKITKEGRIFVMEIGGRMGGDFIGSELVQLSTGYDFVKGVIEVALGLFEKPQKTISKYSGVFFLCEETEILKPILVDAVIHPEKHPEIVSAKIQKDQLRKVTCSADRSGYLIYQSNNKIDLLKWKDWLL